MTEDLGHKITDQRPSIVPIEIKESWPAQLQGLSLSNIKLSVLKENKKQASETGDIIFTHFGISGPAALNLSRNMAEGEQKISIDLVPSLNFEQLERKINNDFNSNPRKDLKNYLVQFMPQRMAVVFSEIFKLNGGIKINNISKIERTALVKYLKNLEVTAMGVLGFELAMATRGGVDLGEIDHKTMKSKLVDNFYFAGEIIDVDGRTGGFNLQSCWSTGYLAGKSSI